MSLHPLGPGKTAPKLHQDLLKFDPLRKDKGGNVLTDCTKPDVEGPFTGAGSCQHEYTTKSGQSVLPPLDLRPDGSTKFKHAVICKKCRIHVAVKIEYARPTNPCPTSEYPIHHFRHLERDEATASRITYHWQCSAPQCQAHLQISFRPARISNVQKDLLTNTENLKRRYEAVVADDPSREGLRQANPMEALSRLRRYVSDAQKPDRKRDAFPADNKRFMEAFGVRGEDCRELFQGYGFRYAADEGLWYLPTPSPLVDRLEADGSSLRELLEDVEMELTAWFYKISSETGLPNPALMDGGGGWPPANRDLERTLAAQGYHRYIAPGLRSNNASELLPFFSGLGILPDFADSLVEFAYERQTFCDPERASYYFECLQIIAENRPNSESLSMKVAVLEPQSVISSRDIRAAYRALGINSTAEGDKADDERLINLFQVRLQDCGPSQKEELRQALYKLGSARGSRMLVNIAQQSVETMDDALSFLGPGASRDTDDDGLIAIYGTKVADNKDDEALAQKALSIIARERKSDKLNNFVAGHGTETTMSVKAAFVRLGNAVENPDEVDQSMLEFIIQEARIQRPGDQTEQAIRTIHEHFASKASKQVNPASWPVGLKSRGNTCYLNSLLQYYFAVKPIRDLVLNYDKYKLPITRDTKKTETVGLVPITRAELVGSQGFAKELQSLFERMVKEPTGEVQPGADLVCRAFLDPRDHELLATDAPVTDEAAEMRERKDPDVDRAPGATRQNDSVNAIEAGQDPAASNQSFQSEDQSSDTKMANGESPTTSPKSHQNDKMASTDIDDADKRPPLPPRRTTKQDLLEMAQDNARQQQDVSEVHDGITQRLRAGMKADGTDERGEQLDPLRDLVACRVSEVVIDQHGVHSKPNVFWETAVTLNVPTEDTDVYTALDDYFALEPRGDSPGAVQNTFKSLVTAPDLLQLSMPRNNYSTDKGMFKSKNVMRFEDEIYLDRYFNNPKTLPKRQRCWSWRSQLKTLKQEQKRIAAGAEKLDGPEAVSAAADYVLVIKDTDGEIQELDINSVSDIDDELSRDLAAEAAQMQARLPSLKTEIEDLEGKLRAEFDVPELKTKQYRLAAVFMHRGEAGGGHYWIFIHDFETDIWRKYNDERVTEVPTSEVKDAIFEAKGEKHDGWTAEAATPTYAVYVSSDKLDLVRPVCRQPEALSTPAASEHQDVEMSTASDWNRAAESPSINSVDPSKLVQEGEMTGWDTARQVADVSW
ncbi:cysteine proteinase [Teratosphaeria nubilosa]|uniref:ubiquitinyl hydrolase 1 n=1 Tax=Teratosphaeria nubilosa TaxID=161662 RepID=A0A6G1KUF6_9PEZI|nr:cysteine proteinase [Teratosphaeria nubilosa]